jgi:hypothetical protein
LVLLMDVDQLLRILKDLPGRLPVVVEDSSAGWMQGTGLYLAPAHFDRRISGTFLHAGHQEGPDDCQALVVSAFYQSNPDYLEITEPPMWAPTIDVEVDVRETTDTGGRSAISGAPAQGYATNLGRSGDCG